MLQSNWYERVAALRQQVESDPHGAGMEALHLFEDWLSEQAQSLGFRHQRGGMSNYVEYLQRRRVLSTDETTRAKRYIDIRNCLSHRSGLLMSGALAEELLGFITSLFRQQALNAEQLMTRNLYTVRPDSPLLEARDQMLRRGLSRLPVAEGEHVVGLLTNRDLLMLQASQGGTKVDPTTLKVADAVSADTLEKVVILPPTATYAEVLDTLKGSNVIAICVTEGGQPEGKLLGIITVSDLLPKL